MKQITKQMYTSWPNLQSNPQHHELCHYIRIMQMTTDIPFLQNIIFDCLKPIYNFLRALGVFPLSRRDDFSEFQFHVQSPSMVYSFLIFVVLLVNMHFGFPSRRACQKFEFLSLSSFSFRRHIVSDLFELYSNGSHCSRSNSRGSLWRGRNCISLYCQSLANHHRASDVVRVQEDCVNT